jgi:hypothetical protein
MNTTFIISNAGMMSLLNLMKQDDLVRDLFEDEDNFEFYDASYSDYGYWWKISIRKADTTTSAKTADRVVEALKPFVVVDSGLFEEFEEHINCYREEQLNELHENEDAEYRANNPNAAEMYREQREREIEEALPTVAWVYLCKRFSLDYYAGEYRINDQQVKETVQALLWPYSN